MHRATPEQTAVRDTAELGTAVRDVEQCVVALADAMRLREPGAIEQSAGDLHQTLADAVQRFRAAARQGPVPEPLRQRLARAGADMASQRESLARATAALDRAIDVLLPDAAPGGNAALYRADGLRAGLAAGKHSGTLLA